MPQRRFRKLMLRGDLLLQRLRGHAFRDQGEFLLDFAPSIFGPVLLKIDLRQRQVYSRELGVSMPSSLEKVDRPLGLALPH